MHKIEFHDLKFEPHSSKFKSLDSQIEPQGSKFEPLGSKFKSLDSQTEPQDSKSNLRVHKLSNFKTRISGFNSIFLYILLACAFHKSHYITCISIFEK